MPKKKFSFSNLEGLQPVILLEIELITGIFQLFQKYSAEWLCCKSFLVASSANEILTHALTW